MRIFKRNSPTPMPARREASVVQFSGTTARETATCRVCGRNLLMGERSVGYFTVQGAGPFEVCELCMTRAQRYGLRPRPSTPDEVMATRRGLRRIGKRRRLAQAASVLPGAAALTEPERDRGPVPTGSAAIPVALAAFNASEHARTLGGLYRTLGEPQASVQPRSPVDREVVLTVAWEIVWYQFRIAPDEIEMRRGSHLEQLNERWCRWNSTVTREGTIQPPLTAGPEEIVRVEAGATFEDRPGGEG
jgi:hypothetical protein